MAMLRSHNLHTIYKAEVIEHPFPPEMGVDLTSANTIIYEMTKLCMTKLCGGLTLNLFLQFCALFQVNIILKKYLKTVKF